MSKLGDDAVHDSHKYKEIRLGPNQISIPQNWSFDKIGKYIHIVTGSPFSSDYFNDRGDGIPLIRIRNLQNGQTSTFYNGDYDKKFLTDNGSILVGMDGNFHTVRWGGRQGLLNQRVARIEVNDKRINESYLFYRLINEIKKIETRTPATTVKHLSKKKIEDIRTPLPPPPEQRRIAEILSTVDELIHQTDAVIEETKRLKRGLMQDLLTRGLGHESFQKVQLGPSEISIPSHWRKAKLGDLAKYQNGYAFKSTDWENHGRPIIRIQNLTNSSGNVTNYYSGPIESKYVVQEGDILVSWSATLDVFIWDGPEAVLNQHIFKVNVSDNINPHFFYYLLSDSIDLLQMRVQGSTMRHITKSTFENTQVPLPPKSEQSRIAEILSTVDDTIQKEQQTKTKLEALKRGLMQDLLTGKVRVPVET